MDVNLIYSRFEAASRVRIPYENVYRDLTKYFSPYREDFITGSMWDSANTDKKPRSDLYNTEGVNAAEMLVSTICNGLLNFASPWFMFSVKDERLAHDVQVRRFLELATRQVAAAINDTSANFYSHAHEFLSDLIIYGTAVMYIEDHEDGIKFCARPLAEMYIAEDHYRQVDSVFRKFRMTAAQIIQRWEDKAPDKVKNTAKKSPDDQFEILHCVMKRDVASISGIETSTKMPYASYYMMYDGKVLLSESGYHEMPYIVARWTRRAGEVYGRSPAWVALPDTKRANAIEKTLLETSERIGNPPILMSDDGVITQLRLAPGQPVIGGLDSMSGQPRLQPMIVGGNIPVTLEMLRKIEQGIRDRFFVGVLSSYNPGVEKTATEVVEYRREESRLMGPNIGKIQAEMLEPIIVRVRNILSRKNALPPLPERLVNTSVELEYTSPLAKLQQSADSDALTRTINTMIPFIQSDPTIMDAIDSDKTMQHIAEINGLPASLMRTADEIAQIRQNRQMQQQAGQTAEALKMASEANLNFSKSASLEV